VPSSQTRPRRIRGRNHPRPQPPHPHPEPNVALATWSLVFETPLSCAANAPTTFWAQLTRPDHRKYPPARPNRHIINAPPTH